MVVNRLEGYWDAPEVGEPVGEQTPPWRQGGDPVPGGSKWTNNVGSMLANHPHATIVAAITAGVILGWLIKRR